MSDRQYHHNTRFEDSFVRRVMEDSTTSTTTTRTNTSPQIQHEKENANRNRVELLVQEIGLEAVWGVVTVIQELGFDSVLQIVDQISNEQQQQQQGGSTTDNAAIPCSVSSTSSAAATAAPSGAPTTRTSHPSPASETPVAFVESDFIKLEPEEKENQGEGEREARGAAFTSGTKSTAATATTTTAYPEQQPLAQNSDENNRHNVVIKLEEINNKDTQPPIKSSNSGRKRKQQSPSPSAEDGVHPSNPNPKAKKKKKKATKNQQGRMHTDYETTSQKQPTMGIDNHAPEQPRRRNDHRAEQDKKEEDYAIDNINEDGTANETNSSTKDNCCPTLSDNKFDRNWLVMHHTLAQFKANNGHCRVPKNYPPDPSLGKWVNNQRSLYRKGKIPPDREEKLNKLGFEWVLVAQTPDQMWQEKYDGLKTYKEENGHCRVPKKYGPDPSLGNWVSAQRNAYKHRKLAEDRAEKLEEIGFVWDSLTETWDEMFGRLKRFKAENGHCRVPQKYAPLGKWVRRQRENCKAGKLAEDRTEKLNKICFEWVVVTRETWDEMFGRLKRFKAENGNCRVPKCYDPDPSLGNWVDNQRRFYKQLKLAEDRVKKLEKIGFEWRLRDR